MSNYIKPVVFCEGCLSTDRKLTGVGIFYDIYVKFFDDDKTPNKIPKNPLLCWECMAVLHTIQKFRKRVEQANNYLNEGLQTINKKKFCLSNLTTTNITDKIIYASYNEDEKDILKQESNGSVEKNELIPDIVEINELKTENDFEYEIDVDTDYVPVINDTDKIDTKESIKKSKSKPMRRNSYTNIRYTVKELTKEEMRAIRKNCKRIIMSESEIGVWREKLKMARFYRVMKYKCDTCISGFSNKEFYDYHMKTRHDETIKDNKCNICSQNVKSRFFASHMRMHVTKYECAVCNNEFHPVYNLDTHLNSTHRKIVECMKCGLQFRHRMECNSHYIKTHMRFICNDCGNGYTSKKRLIHHIGLKHTEHLCKICNKSYSSQDSLKRHNLVTHIKAASEESYCVECNMQFNNLYVFQRHLATSTKHKQKRFPCPDCGKVYHKRTTLNNHYNHVHLQKTKNYCEICDRYFLTGFRLRQHKATVHDHLPKPKTKMCSFCGRAFHTNRILQNHIRTHTGERPFHCEFCTASFTQKNALVSHTKAIHKVT